MLAKSEEQNRGKWKLGVVETPIEGRDGGVRAVRLKSGKAFIERPIQHLYPLELSCDIPTRREAQHLRAETRREFRPSRRAAVAARDQVRAITRPEDNED